MSRRPNAFSLLEILVTVTVLAILVTVTLSNFQNQLLKARDAKRKANLDRIKIALYDRFIDSGCFPSGLPDCGQSLAYGTSAYLVNWPCDPKTNTGYVYRSDNQSCPRWFQVYTTLENSHDRSIDESGCSNGCGPDCAYNYGVSSTNIKVDEGCLSVPESGTCKNPKQTLICHRPGEDNQQELCVDPDALADHLGHHDYQGNCSATGTTPTSTPEPTKTPKPTKEK